MAIASSNGVAAAMTSRITQVLLWWLADEHVKRAYLGEDDEVLRAAAEERVGA